MKITTDKKSPEGQRAVIIGAGPAGLTAAYELLDSGVHPMVFEKDDIVGGISRTVRYKDYKFDIGGHRFFTKVKVVEDMWHEVMKDDFLLRKRSSRILYQGKYFYYPMQPVNALLGLGFGRSILVMLSYAKSLVSPIYPERSFQDWVSNRFGRKLFNIFFKTYTEKVWGIPCTSISADWAAQRIQGFSIKVALKNALVGNRVKSKKDVVKTLIGSFHYPRHGPGMMWERVTDLVRERGGEVELKSDVTKVSWSGQKVHSVDVKSGDSTRTVEGDHFVSTMPVRELIEKLDPPPPADILEAGRGLKYRDFLTVALVIDRADVFSDNWIYVHDESVKVGRLQNFKSWSPEMVPDPSKTCIGLEYFCFEGDSLWETSDEELVELASVELEKLGIVTRDEIEDGAVARMPKAYPVYDEHYAEYLESIREFADTLENIYLVGRNGMHRYNNQDHSMLSAMLACENILGASNDIWSINEEGEYHEATTREELERQKDINALNKSQPHVPVAEPGLSDAVLLRILSRLDKAALAGAVGMTFGSVLFLMTLVAVLQADPFLTQNLSLISEFFVGYAVSVSGAFLGLLHGLIWGGVVGWLFAYVHNIAIGLYSRYVLRQVFRDTMKDLLDYI